VELHRRECATVGLWQTTFDAVRADEQLGVVEYEWLPLCRPVAAVLGVDAGVLRDSTSRTSRPH
jgi:hypothetical protein